MALRENLEFKNLDKMFDGRVPALFNLEMKRAIRDCADRPHEKKPRTVQITFRMSPVPESEGDEADIEVEVASSVPKSRTKIHTVSTKVDGSATFHPDFAEEPDANGIFDDVHRKEPPQQQQE